jgi:hypothetical protein
MVVNGDGEHFFGVLLADDEFIEFGQDRRRVGDLEAGFFRGSFAFRGCATEFLFKDVLADVDALVADIDAGAGDQFFDLGVALSAERTHR